ncbi:ParB N-terminal domain-containing protein, partial [Escherichia sp. HC-CC]
MLESIHGAFSIPKSFKASTLKYHQIVTSIESLGIIEPIIVFYDKDKDVTKILDGHLRVEALKDLGIEKAPCILSSIDDAF